MLWSTFANGRYVQAISYSTSSLLRATRDHGTAPLFLNNGGHGMLFRAFDGTQMLALHQPNDEPRERLHLQFLANLL